MFANVKSNGIVLIKMIAQLVLDQDNQVDWSFKAINKMHQYQTIRIIRLLPLLMHFFHLLMELKHWSKHCCYSTLSSIRDKEIIRFANQTELF